MEFKIEGEEDSASLSEEIPPSFDISLDQVSFAYPGAGNPSIFDRLSLKIPGPP